MGDNIHKGHRERMRKKFLKEGIDSFEVHEALEMLLYYAVPYKDTNPMAHKLLDQFGSLSAVIDANPKYLKELGYSEYVISLLKMIPEFSRLYYMDKTENKSKIIETNDLGNYFLPKYYGRTEEVLMILLLDDKNKEVFSGILSKGSFNSTDVPVRKIVELAISYNARAVVIAHNHPGGVALPSKMDMDTTALIEKVLRNIGVYMLDHIIVSDDDYISLRNSRYGKVLYSNKDD